MPIQSIENCGKMHILGTFFSEFVHACFHVLTRLHVFAVHALTRPRKRKGKMESSSGSILPSRLRGISCISFHDSNSVAGRNR